MFSEIIDAGWDISLVVPSGEKKLRCQGDIIQYWQLWNIKASLFSKHIHCSTKYRCLQKHPKCHKQLETSWWKLGKWFLPCWRNSIKVGSSPHHRVRQLQFWPQPGQMGRIAVIGGSEDYTGAPYFSAMASARLGADMVFMLHPRCPSSTDWNPEPCHLRTSSCTSY